MDELKREMVGFWLKFARLLSAGVPILQTLKVMADEAANPELKKAAAALRRSIEEGSNLSEAMKAWPSLFPLSVLTLIRAGEVGGRLAEIAGEVARGVEEGSLSVGAAEAPAGASIEGAEPAGDPPVVRTVSQILVDGVDRRASDIHLESTAEGLRVRFRVDGVLQVAEKTFHPEERDQIIRRFKIMANMNIAETRRPQDGRIQILMRGKRLDMRVSTVPYAAGECITVRILDASNVCHLDLEHQGMTEPNLARLRGWIRRPSGLIVACGPTGSGKTTTMYSMLCELNRPEIKITTVEDPVEYLLAGICQQGVHVPSGVTFATALRAQMRQDPDVIMVGELRDLDTAMICVQAALTGHLVLTSLHAADAVEGIRRLLDMGVEPFVLNATLIGTWAQRLVRTVCAKCRREVSMPAGMEAVAAATPGLRFFSGQGCDECRQTRYRGRTAVHELLEVDDDLRRLIAQDSGVGVLREQAVRWGMRTMMADGLAKASQGITSVEEVLRVCGR